MNSEKYGRLKRPVSTWKTWAQNTVLFNYLNLDPGNHLMYFLLHSLLLSNAMLKLQKIE